MPSIPSHSWVSLSTPICSFAWLSMSEWLLSHLDVQKGTGVKVAPITFALLTTYKRWTIKLGRDIVAIIFCKQQTQHWDGWIVKSKYGYTINSFANMCLPTNLLMRNHLATFWICASSSCKKSMQKSCSLRSLELFTWCNLWPKFVFIQSLFVDIPKIKQKYMYPKTSNK